MLQNIPTPSLREARGCVLETERLTLRKPTLADVKAIANLANDRRIAENTRRLPHPYLLDHGVEFVRAIADGHPHLVDRLFVGRLTLGDVLRLEESFGDGTIAPAAFVPRWAARRPALAAYLSFSGLINRIDLSRIDLRALWGGA